MTDRHWVYRPLLDLIGEAEGTDREDGYNETLAYGAYTGGDVDLVSMTLDQVDRLQGQMLAHPKNRWNSSAAGRYQIVRKTRRAVQQRLGLSGDELYDEDMQDRMARVLLYDRGIDDYAEGEQDEDKTLLELAREWASFPTPDGKGYYSGQGGKLKPARVRTALKEVSRRYHSEPEVVVAPTSSPPPTGYGSAPWMEHARDSLGVKEVSGSRGNNPEIVQMFEDVGHSWVKDDETAWCAAFVGSMLKRAGFGGTGKLNARSYLEWGQSLIEPAPGCVVVFWRGSRNSWKGHVAFYVGQTADSIRVLGGNQRDAVTITTYPRDRLLGYRWPSGFLPAALSAERPDEKETPRSGWAALFAALMSLFGRKE